MREIKVWCVANTHWWIGKGDKTFGPFQTQEEAEFIASYLRGKEAYTKALIDLQNKHRAKVNDAIKSLNKIYSKVTNDLAHSNQAILEWGTPSRKLPKYLKDKVVTALDQFFALCKEVK